MAEIGKAVRTAVGDKVKPVKICYISQTLGIGGAEVFVCELLSELQTRRNIVCAYTNLSLFRTELHKHKIKSGKIPVVFDIIGNWRGFIKAILLLPYYFLVYGIIVWKERKNDVLLVSGFAEKLPISWWASIFGVRVAWIEFSPLHTVTKKFFGLPRLWYVLAAKFPAAVITASEHSKRGLLAEGILRTEKLVVLPCGRDLEIIKEAQVVQSPEIICISRMEQGKGQDLLVRAFSLVRKKVPKAHLTLVGEGDFLPTIEHLVATLGLKKYVTITGRVSDALSLLENARVCVAPSVWSLEGFGLVACEAMAFGKPVVAFNRGPVNEIVIHNKTGLLAQDRNISELADKISTLLLDKSLAFRLGSAGLHRFATHYKMSSVAKKYELFLQEICPKK